MGIQVSNGISSESTHQIHSLKFMHTSGVSAKVVKRIVEFRMLTFGLFFLLFLTC